MNTKTTPGTGLRPRGATLLLLFSCSYGGLVCAQDRSQAPLTDVDIEILSAEITRFDKPIRIGTGERAIEYQEALVLKGQVDRVRFDALPPSMEPFLYIGGNEYHMFGIDRDDDRRTLILTFHIRDWERLPDGAPVVLTIDHGAPSRHPERFIRRGVPRFRSRMIVDNR